MKGLSSEMRWGRQARANELYLNLEIKCVVKSLALVRCAFTLCQFGPELRLGLFINIFICELHPSCDNPQD